MQKNFTKALALSFAAMTLFSGCTKNTSDIAKYTIEGNKISGAQVDANGNAIINLSAQDIANIPLVTKEALNENSAVNAATIRGDTENEILGQVYDYVSGNVQVDTSNLIPLTAGEEKLIRDNITSVISCLKGSDNKAMPDDFANYMLWELARTQKQWDVQKDAKGNPTSYEILGIDPATRKVFVDMTFYTTNDNKLEIPKSDIIKGSYTENNAKALRQKQYLAYLDAKIDYENILNGNTGSSGSIFGGGIDTESALLTAEARMNSALKEFEDTWGDLDQILLEQQELSLIKRVRNYIQTDTTRKNFELTEAYKKYLLEESDLGFTEEKILALNKIGNFNNFEKYEAYLRDQCGFTNEQLAYVKMDYVPSKYLQTQKIGTYTYTGISGQTTFTTNASRNQAIMTFRFIFDFDYNLSTQASVKTTSVYLKDYKLVGYENTIAGFKIDEDKEVSIPVVTPYLDYTIYAYQRSIEEDNMIGLYSLFGSAQNLDEFTSELVDASSRFQDWDKYYSDWMRYCYTKFNAYDYEIVGWNKDTIQIVVQRSKKIRGKGTQMTFPTYTERVLIELAVENDKVFIKNETVLETTLVGEPLSMIREVTGISDKIAFDSKAFSEASEKGVLLALQNLSKYQLDYLYDAAATTGKPQIELSYSKPGAISYGIDASTLETIKTNMTTAITDKTNNKLPTEKITYLGTWATKSNVYCRVRIRETFMLDGKDTALNTESYVGLVNRDGIWVVVSYERSNTTVGTAPTSDKGCLAHDYADGRPSTTRYKESEADAQRGMGEGTVIDYTKFTSAGGNTGVGTPSTPESSSSSSSSSSYAEPTTSSDTSSSTSEGTSSEAESSEDTSDDTSDASSDTSDTSDDTSDTSGDTSDTSEDTSSSTEGTSSSSGDTSDTSGDASDTSEDTSTPVIPNPFA